MRTSRVPGSQEAHTPEQRSEEVQSIQNDQDIALGLLPSPHITRRAETLFQFWVFELQDSTCTFPNEDTVVKKVCKILDAPYVFDSQVSSMIKLLEATVRNPETNDQICNDLLQQFSGYLFDSPNSHKPGLEQILHSDDELEEGEIKDDAPQHVVDASYIVDELEEGEIREGELDEGEVGQDKAADDSDEPLTGSEPQGETQDDMDEEDLQNFYDDQVAELGIGLPSRVEAVPAAEFFVGQIGWKPMPMIAKDLSSAYVVKTDIGNVLAKCYPVVVVNKVDDSAEVVIVETSAGKGLARKPESLKRRCLYIVEQGHRPKFNDNSNRTLETAATSAFHPAAGAFLDPLNTQKIPYDTSFVPAGYLTDASKEDLLLERFRASHDAFSRNTTGSEALMQRVLATRQASGEHRLNGTTVIETEVAVSIHGNPHTEIH